MAAEVPKSLALQVIHGPKKYDVKLQLPPNEAGDALCVRHLTDAVYNITDIPAEAQRLIYKGKSLKDPKEDLKAAGLRPGAKVMLIGKKPVPKDDANTRILNEVESSVEKATKKLGDITYELDGIHRGYLEKDQQMDAVRQKEKQMKTLAENMMRMLEKLDGLRFDEANRSARAKRKSLVDKIQGLLDSVDGLSRGITEIQMRHADGVL